MNQEATNKLERIHEIIAQKLSLDTELEELLTPGGGTDHDDDDRDESPRKKSGKQRRLTDEDKKKILELVKGGMTKPRVAEVMGISAAGVSYVVNKAKKGSFSADRDDDQRPDKPDADADVKRGDPDLEETKKNILRMHRNGNGVITIAKLIGVSRYEVKEVIDRAIEDGEVEEDYEKPDDDE